MHRTGRTKATDLGGLARSMPWTTAFGVVGAASLSAVPLFSGFISKSMVMAAAAEEGYTVAWVALLVAAAGVIPKAGLKVPWRAFFHHDAGLRPERAPLAMRWAMGLGALLCVGLGVLPGLLYAHLPYPVDYRPYTWGHVLTQLQLLVFAVLAVWIMVRIRFYPEELRRVNLDADRLFRAAARGFVRFVEGPLERFLAGLSRAFHEGVVGRLAYAAKNPPGVMRLAVERFRLAFVGLFGSIEEMRDAEERYEAQSRRYEATRPGAAWPIGRIALYLTLALFLYLVAYLLRG
jgi:multicomponent Na+:H+ antiporter subunit D